jgi:hypothetical protein
MKTRVCVYAICRCIAFLFVYIHTVSYHRVGYRLLRLTLCVFVCGLFNGAVNVATLCSVEWQHDEWMLKWKEFETERLLPILRHSRGSFQEGLKKTTEHLGQYTVVGVPADIRKGHIPNAGQKSYRALMKIHFSFKNVQVTNSFKSKHSLS